MTQAAKILIVDDTPEVVGIIERLLSRRGYHAVGLSDSRQAIDLFRSFRPDACILDFAMPYVSGSELLDSIKAIDPMVETVFLTAEDGATLAVDLMKRGAIDFLIKPIDLDAVARSVSQALEHRRLLMENEAYRARLEALVAEKTRALNEALRDLTIEHSATLDSLSMALDFDEEWRVMVRHAEYGFEFLSKIGFLKGAAEIVYSHHEKFDGSGYPRGLRSDAIPLGARVFAVVDAVDAMICTRPYHAAVSFEEAAGEVRRCSGRHFDPALVEPALTYLADHLPHDLHSLAKRTASME